MKAQISQSASGDPILQFLYKGNYRHIPVKDILFIESRERKCFLHLTDSLSSSEELCFYGKLNNIADILLPYGFIRCHQSYLVSMKANIRYYNNHFYYGDIELPVSERYRKNILNIFNRQPPTNDTAAINRDNPASHIPTTGALVCIKGDYYGSIIRIYSNVTCSIGRDRELSEIIINLPYISRSHCDIVYKDNNTYELTDHSHNGTFYITGDGDFEKLTTDKKHSLPAGSIICFGDTSLQYRLI